MKKILVMLCTLVAVFMLNGNAYANDQVAKQKAIDWEISMMPKPTAEEVEAARWSVVVENDLGVYALQCFPSLACFFNEEILYGNVFT